MAIAPKQAYEIARKRSGTYDISEIYSYKDKYICFMGSGSDDPRDAIVDGVIVVDSIGKVIPFYIWDDISIVKTMKQIPVNEFKKTSLEHY